MKKILGTKKELETQPTKKTEIVRVSLCFLLRMGFLCYLGDVNQAYGHFRGTCCRRS